MKNILSLNEWKNSNTQTYIKHINAFYNDANFTNQILSGELAAFQMIGNNDIKTIITDNDNLLIRYVENDSLICLLGLTTEKGRIRREDIIELNSFGDELLNKILSGMTLMTFPNDVSELLIDRMLKKAESKNIILKKEKSHPMKFDLDVEDKFTNYKMIKVSL